jgi:hypothetical protein
MLQNHDGAPLKGDQGVNQRRRCHFQLRFDKEPSGWASDGLEKGFTT